MGRCIFGVNMMCIKQNVMLVFKNEQTQVHLSRNIWLADRELK